MIDIDKEVKKIIINQFCGLGDILFSIPIVSSLHEMGYDIIWPIDPSFMNIQKSFEFIKFIKKDDFPMNYDSDSFIKDDDKLIIPLRYSNNLLNNGYPITCMSDKYKLVDMSLDSWKSLKWQRDLDSENRLYFDVLGLKENEEYNLLNVNFSMGEKINIVNYDSNIRSVNFDIIDGFSILDWYKVIQNSTNIYTVGTSIVFMIEVIPTNRLKEYVLYARRPFENDCKYYNYLLSKPTSEI
jgi:hypothetical protein